MRNVLKLLVLKVFVLLPFVPATGLAQPVPSADPEGALHYIVDRRAALYHASDSSRAYLNLRFREPVHVFGEVAPGWLRARTRDGANGLVKAGHVSNVWVRVSKSTQTVFVYRGQDLIFRFAADLGYNFFSDKVQRGSDADPDHWRTPEGEFFVVAKNPNSQFYKAFVLNYPNAEDAERGLRDGLISEAEYQSILSAENDFRVPPMSTALGGYIELHGNGTGRRSNWTQGCVAIQNDQMDTLWNLISVGTPVLIDP